MFEELKLDSYINENKFHILEHGNQGEKACFYADHENNMIIDLLDSKGKSVKHISNILKIKKSMYLACKSSESMYLACKSSENYILNAALDVYSVSVFGNPISRGENDKEIMIKIDKEFNYVMHTTIDYCESRMTSNTSAIICIDKDENFHYYDTNLVLVTGKPFYKITH
jgi:hypothetical protein